MASAVAGVFRDLFPELNNDSGAWFIASSGHHVAWVAVLALAELTCLLRLSYRLAFGELCLLRNGALGWCVDVTCDVLFCLDVLVQQARVRRRSPKFRV